MKNRNNQISVNFRHETYRGEKSKLISIFEAKGYQAQRDGQNEHEYFQMADHIKRI